MDFLILRPLPPKTGYHFFERGGGGGGLGGSKVFAQKATSSGEAQRPSHDQRSTGNAGDVRLAVGGSNPGLLTFGADGGAKFARPDERRSAALPLGYSLHYSDGLHRCLWPLLLLTKNPNCVYLSDCLPACWLRD